MFKRTQQLEAVFIKTGMVIRLKGRKYIVNEVFHNNPMTLIYATPKKNADSRIKTRIELHYADKITVTQK